MILQSAVSSWTRSLVSLPILGLDFSDLSLKFIRFDKRGQTIAVRSIGSHPITEGVMVNGKVEKPDGLVSALKDLKDQDGRSVHERFVVASLPEEKGFIQILRLPRIKLENLAGSVRWELESAIPLPLDEVYFDYEVVPSEAHSDHTDILVLAYPRAVVDSYAGVLRDAGFTPLALELESQAIARALIPSASKVPALIVDIGATRTSFVLVANGGIIHTSTISISGQMFETDIAKASNVSQERARELKVEVGLDLQKEGGVVARALLESLRVLVDEILRHVDFYRNHAKDRTGAGDNVEKLILTGGDANLVGLDSYLARSTRIEVERGNPFGLLLPHMKERIPPVSANAAHGYTTAIGLALRDIFR